jgi:oligopeptide/dipeptide ABC transporter ATP-binding protein
MRQRVVIAIALANEPNVLIADEPTTALDVTTQAQVLDLLNRLVSDRGTAVVFVTHNFGVISEFCDRLMVMYAGKIVEEGSTRPVLKYALHPYTEALLQCIPDPRQRERPRLPSIPGSPPNLARLPRGCSFEPRCPIGKGVQDCIAIEPARTAVALQDDTIIAECHFAKERADRKSTSGHV